ncbi:hypothetical protein LXL04_029305 [Taraxacum kok-saghyz]
MDLSSSSSSSRTEVRHYLKAPRHYSPDNHDASICCSTALVSVTSPGVYTFLGWQKKARIYRWNAPLHVGTIQTVEVERKNRSKRRPPKTKTEPSTPFYWYKTRTKSISSRPTLLRQTKLPDQFALPTPPALPSRELLFFEPDGIVEANQHCQRELNYRTTTWIFSCVFSSSLMTMIYIMIVYRTSFTELLPSPVPTFRNDIS